MAEVYNPSFLGEELARGKRGRLKHWGRSTPRMSEDYHIRLRMDTLPLLSMQTIQGGYYLMPILQMKKKQKKFKSVVIITKLVNVNIGQQVSLLWFLVLMIRWTAP